MRFSALFLLFILLLCYADEGEARRSKDRSRRKRAVSGSSNTKIDSKIKSLEKRFQRLSRKRTCKDGLKGKDGDCQTICSTDHQLTFEKPGAKEGTGSGRVACCKAGEVVTATGACRNPDRVPALCYQLRGRLVRLASGKSFLYLRGFEGTIDDFYYKCDNNGCCSFPQDLLQSFEKCGISLDLFRFSSSSECFRYGIADKLNFDIANPAPFFGDSFSREIFFTNLFG